MAEELNDASDIKRLIGKNKGEEDPLLVAQRFLNIFRQLHIFDQKRRDEFNSMILALSPEIRGSFGILPGGSILQEYVDELEISKGIARSNTSSDIPTSILSPTQDKESPLSKIKNAQQQETTAAPVNISGNAKLVADASFAQVLSHSVSNALMAAQASKNVDFDKLIEAIKDNPANAKIVPDEKFATTMAKAFSQALHYSDAGKKADIKELIEAVRESRKIELPEGVSLGGNGGNTPLIADEAAFARTIAMAVAKVVHDSNNNAGLGAEIRELANAVRESRKLELPEGFALGAPSTSTSTPLIANEASFAQAIAMAVAKVVHDSNNNANLGAEIRELANAVRESRKLELPEGFSFGGSSGGFAGPLISDEAAFAKTIAEAMARVVNVGASAATSAPDMRELANVLKENNSSNVEAISQAMVNSLTPLLISLEKNNNNNQFILDKINVIADHNFAEVIAKAFSQTFEISEQKHLEQTERLISGIQNALINNAASPTIVSESGNYIPNVNSGQMERIAQDFTDTLRSINENQRLENQEISRAIKETGRELLRMFEKQNTNRSNAFDKDVINEIISNVAQAQLGIFQEMAKQQTAELSNILSVALKENSKIMAENTKKSNKARSIFNFAALRQNDNLANTSYNMDDISAPQVTEIKDTHSTVKEKKSSIAQYIKTAFERPPLEETETSSGSDWGFSETETEIQTEENVSVADDNTGTEVSIETEEPTVLTDEANEDWSWEYETTEESDISGDEGTDWEWEYEEEPSTPLTTSEDGNQLQSDDNNSNENVGVEGEDWEWEYDDSVELSGEEGADWEWEYDESDAIETQSSEGEDWEWEYEEDDNSTADFVSEDTGSTEPDIIGKETAEDLFEPAEIPFQDNGEIVIAELRNQQNFADPYLCENISV